MARRTRFEHQFVEFVPEYVEEGVLYVSLTYKTAVHKCYCGCGNQVVTPISPSDWEVTFDGEAVTLFPSIGNWGFPCRSHYWIERNRVVVAPSWTDEEIEEARAEDRDIRTRRYAASRSFIPRYRFPSSDDE